MAKYYQVKHKKVDSIFEECSIFNLNLQKLCFISTNYVEKIVKKNQILRGHKELKELNYAVAESSL